MDTISPLAPTQPGRPSRPSDASRIAARDRRGSILIFVVGILLLLAIIATAFLGTSRSDRTSTQQNANNTQADLLLEGVVNAMKGVVLADARYNATADGYDSPNDDAFLSSRTPGLFNSANVVSSANPPMWSSITAPQLGGVFSYPMTLPANGSLPVTYSTRHNIAPTSIIYQGSTLPAFYVNLTDQNGNWPTNIYASSAAIPAMDADGDGIADSGMVQLPIGPIAGLSYYYGARVVDLNSAINFNTALAWHAPTVPSGQLVGNFFPSNIDLQSILSGVTASTQLDNLVAYQTNNQAPTFNGFVSTSPINAYDDNDTLRADFQFSTAYEMYWLQLGRRMANPGYVTSTSFYRSIDINSTVALASQFVLADPSGSQSKIETLLTDSLTKSGNANVQSAQFTDPTTWYNSNFNFATPMASPQPMPLRALLTGTNAVGNDAAANSVDSANTAATAWTSGATYTFGDIVTFGLPAGAPTSVTRQFVCIQPHTSSALNSPDQLAGAACWGLLSGAGKVQKIDVNTADFGELWWGFRRLMAVASDKEKQLFTPPYFQNTTDPFTGRMFRSTVRDPAAFPDYTTAGAHYLSSSEMLQVRSALAAVNAMALRKSDDNVVARRILTCNFGTYGQASAPAPIAQHAVTVFGTGRQPFVTEVYATNDTTYGTRGYVAVELYNPYPVPLNLNGWTLGVIDRRTGTYPLAINGIPSTVTPGSPVVFDNTATPNKYVVPANGYLILENYKDATNPTADTTSPGTSDATSRPQEVGASGVITFGPTTASAYVPNLAAVIYDGTPAAPGVADGGELVLLRPRNDNLTTGVTTPTVAPNDPTDPCDEGTATAPNLYDLVPVDSFDFSGMAIAAAGGQFNAWHYVRSNDTTSTTAAGHYAMGAYLMTAAGMQRQGAASAPFNAGQAPTFPMGSPLVQLGMPDQVSTVTSPMGADTHPGVQILAPGWPSPNAATTTGTGNKYPFGAFARESDLFQIPYIGSYKVLTTNATGVAENVTGQPGDFTEMNTVAVDESFADDGDSYVYPALTPVAGNDDPDEQVGRFCPLSSLSPAAYKDWRTTNTPAARDWYDFSAIDPTTGNVDISRPSRTIFDIFTTQSPLNASLPPVSADGYIASITGTAGTNYSATPTPVQLIDTNTAPGCSYVTNTTNNGSGNTVVCSPTLPASSATLYKNCLVQVLTGASKGRIAQIVNISSSGTPATVQLSLSPAVGALAAGD
ncbi:MAG: hypothetical protein ACTHLN_15275, partial [Tepidisphaeraceae bacterium]